MASGIVEFQRSKPLPSGPGWRSPGGDGIGRGDDGDGASRGPIPLHTYYTGLWLALAAVTMFFVGLTSALVVRRGISSDWTGIALPRILFVNTLVLAASSFLLERTRRRLRSLPCGKDARLRGRFGAVLLLGLAFLAGQLGAWRELAAHGIFLGTNPSSSFIYLLTAAHGLHLAGGLIAITWVALRARSLAASTRGRTVVGVVAIYWHFMGILWIYIVALLKLNM